MRDRLIKELDSADLFLRNRANSSPAPLNDYDIEEMLDIAKICDEAARTLEKAIIPPCKVGDTVYVYSGDFGVILPYFVENLTIAYLEENKFCYTYEANCNNDDELLDSIDFNCEDFGKTVFLTREEAEKKLRGDE